MLNLWPNIGPKAEKKIPLNLGIQFGTLGANAPAIINIVTPMFLHSLVTWAKQQAKNAQSWPEFFQP
jgi:hypothetical protein